ncbi:MAG: SDR family oxidoreductase [FCB group bacterium]|nr:SDR family oxidoreductase [FCB group bacterium]
MTANPHRFENKIAVVTGGVRGIGAAIVRRFLTEGAVVHVLDLNQPGPDEFGAGDSVIFHSGDVSDGQQVDTFFKDVIRDHGRVDILVNNAGIVRDHVIWKMSERDFDDVIAVNLKGAWLMCRAAAPLLRKQNSGRIVNIASRAWLGNFGQSNYSASKGGLISLTRVLALELARYNVTVNAVAPGLIDTPLTRGLGETIFQKLVAAQPGKKPGTVDDVAAAVLFLASDEARFINGQVLHVDGGKSIGATVV